MESSVNVYLKIKRDPKDSEKYSVSDLFCYNEDLGSYCRVRLLEELGKVKSTESIGLIKVIRTKIDKSLTNNKNIYFDNLDDVIRFFEE